MRKNKPAVCTAMALPALIGSAQAADPVAGEYILHLSGCVSCHAMPDQEDTNPLSGGLELKTPFGIFRIPNITPDEQSGIGSWDFDDFKAAMQHGMRPDGAAYYPAFPYTSYRGMREADLADLWAYLQKVPPVRHHVADHDLAFPWSVRSGLPLWQALYLEDPDSSEDMGRGEYIVRHLSHCGECHTERGTLGAVKPEKHLQGTATGPHGKRIPSALTDWSAADYDFALEIGMLPDGDFFGGSMGDVIANTTSKMTPEDRKAVVDYLMTLRTSPL